MDSFGEVEKLLEEALAAYRDCRKTAAKAEGLAKQVEIYAKESQYWLKTLRRHSLAR